MTKTSNYSLNLPESNDYVSINPLNENTQKIDQELKKLSDAMAPGAFIYDFSAASWVAANGKSTITIQADKHGLSGSWVSWQAFLLSDGAYVGNAWAAMETTALLDESGNIVLSIPEASGYAGRVILTAHK